MTQQSGCKMPPSHASGGRLRGRFRSRFHLLLAALLATAVVTGISAGYAGTAAAAEREKIHKVNLVFKSDIRPGDSGGDVEITVPDEDAPYTVSSWEIVNDTGEEWNELESPIIRVELNTETDSHYFGSTSSGGFKLTLAETNVFRKVEFEKATRENDRGTVFLTVKLRFRVAEDLADTVYSPKKPKWSEEKDGTGSWEKAIGAEYYQVQLEKDGVLIDKILPVYDLTHEFGSQIQEPGLYRFQVRTVSENKNKGKWIKSDRMAVTQEQLGSIGSGWKMAADKVRWWWSNGDGTWPVNQWQDVSGEWYYFDAEGYMVTGWTTVDGKDYYFDPDSGAMYRDTTTPDAFRAGTDGAKLPDENQPEPGGNESSGQQE